ncbi:MAG TPA: extracellular solute-binding protein, partial [Burkholderiaceae bacterium]|nr:extracellular solute-binding protein [Burkholderiaceae bacterium]
MKPLFRLSGVCLTLMALSGTAAAATEIQWWHAMTGTLGDRLNTLADRFNKSQPDYKIVPVFKGSYPETLAASIAAFRAGSAPHIVQVFEVGTATMMASKGAIVPVEKIMKDAGEKFDRAAYVPAVAGFYTTRQGEMLSFPFNSSTTVFYFNKDALAAAGVSKPPETWPEVAAAAAKVKAAGATKCGYTTSWPSWVHMENFSAWHNVLFATENNGFGGLKARMSVDTALHEKHLANLADWSKKGYFTYAGRTNEGD